MPEKLARGSRRDPGDGLPLPLTPLLGRERELADIERLLDASRLVTLTGAGGSGKTRLALELAHRVRDRFDSVAWIDLAAIAHGNLVAPQILGALGVRESLAEDPVQLIVATLRDEPALLVIDNCEHVVDDCATAVETVLRGCPDVRVVTTTREALGVAGERTWVVPPLPDDDAVRLFVERAQAVLPSLQLTDENAATVLHICRRLDGIPLAIELAAARAKVLSLTQIADRLGDAFRLLSAGSRTVPRHRTIRETIDWSFRLLAAAEQLLLLRLSVFAGTFSLDDAEAVCGDERLDRDEVLDLLSALVDKSLVVRDASGKEPRYRMLETVRQFSADKLAAAGERDAVRERFARHYVERCEALEPKLLAGAGDPATMEWIDAELSNVHAVFDWIDEDPARIAQEFSLVHALHWYWFARGYFHEARRRAAKVVQRAGQAPSRLRAYALLAAADIAIWCGDWRAPRPMVEEAIPEFRAIPDRRRLAHALTLLGVSLAFGEGKIGESQLAFDEAESNARGVRNSVALALTLFWSGLAAEMRGDNATARSSFEEARRLGEELNHKPAMAHPLTALGHIAIREGNLDEAAARLGAALALHAETDDRWGLTQAVEGIGLVLLETGAAEAGVRILAGATAAWLQLGARPGRHPQLERAQELRIRQAVADDQLRIALASGAAMPYEVMVSIAREEMSRLPSLRNPTPASAARLRVRALGELAAERSGEVLDTSQAVRAWEMLLFLLCNRSGCTREQIGAALWAEAEPSKVRNNFHVTLHRLRKMLGEGEWVVAEGETYGFDPNVAIEFDAEMFEREARHALRVASTTSDATTALAGAIELYRGDFVTTAGDWGAEVRERLRALFLEALAALGRVHMSAGDFERARIVYQRMIDIDPVDEQAVRNLMRCLAQTGDTAAASLAYRTLAMALRSELGAEPDPATTKLHARIVEGG